jgi:hypothetical protein
MDLNGPHGLAYDSPSYYLKVLPESFRQATSGGFDNCPAQEYAPLPPLSSVNPTKLRKPAPKSSVNTPLAVKTLS